MVTRQQGWKGGSIVGTGENVCVMLARVERKVCDDTGGNAVLWFHGLECFCRSTGEKVRVWWHGWKRAGTGMVARA